MSLTLVSTSFALGPDSQLHGPDRQRTDNHRAQRAPQQGAEEKNSTVLRYHVCRVSAVSCAQGMTFCSTQKGCATHHATVYDYD